MRKEVEDYISEANALRRENEDLRERLKTMQKTIRRYQVEKQEFMKKHGIAKMGPKIGGEDYDLLASKNNGTKENLLAE